MENKQIVPIDIQADADRLCSYSSMKYEDVYTESLIFVGKITYIKGRIEERNKRNKLFIEELLNAINHCDAIDTYNQLPENTIDKPFAIDNCVEKLKVSLRKLRDLLEVK